MKVKDVMTKEIISVSKNEDLEHIMHVMEKNNITKVPVVEDGKLLGIITDGEIAYKLGSIRKKDVTTAHMYASSVMIKKYETVTPDTPVEEIIKTVGLPGPTMLPVVENEKLVGVVTKADLLPLVKGKEPVSSIMTKRIITVEPEDRVIHARRLMIDNNIARIPVVKTGNVLGIIAEMDIARAFAKLKKSFSRTHQKHRVDEMLVQDAMNPQVVTVKPEVSIQEAAEIMLKRDIGALPVVDGKLLGIVTRTDLIRTLKGKKV
ncbi:MAG TPA: CBS domain-containing protein [Thermoplasmatales archaeon]|nr:CBS domain-containing protein [Thermoplasmatales archaeon]